MKAVKEKFTVWTAKYALTQGIEKLDVEWSSEFPDRVVQRRGGSDRILYGKGRVWFRSEQAAIDRAEVLRNRKIKLLEAQIVRLKDMRFKAGDAK